MAITIGQKLGTYEVVSLLGKGGMGEVYRARDTRLKREVAIKVLPDEFSRDHDRVSRFQREAEVLATLNHPNIAAIHDLHEAGESRFLVLELVEGETLADRLKRGPLPIEEALEIAKQICEALEAAHEKGIIHRDLKPANIKMTTDGKVKVLDFGLAKGMGQENTDASLSNSPTISMAATNAGVILGTAAYISPEQARGRLVDRRADIWAFGCLLYEMFAGRRAFIGEDVPDTLAAVMRGEPDWNALPTIIPEPIRLLLRRCLVKDRRKRVGDIAAALFAFDVSARGSSATEPDSAYILRETAAAQAEAAASNVRQAMIRSSRRRMVSLTGWLVLGFVAIGAGLWFATRPAPPRIVRTIVTTSGASMLTVTGQLPDLAITPDGTRIVYNILGGVAVRAFDNLEPAIVNLPGRPQGLFVSPDGQWVGFNSGRAQLQKVAITGGPPVTLVRNLTNLRGATWGPDETIIFGKGTEGEGLQRVSAAGGEPAALTWPDRERGEHSHRWPEFLPGGQAVLFTIWNNDATPATAQIAVLDLRTGVSKVLIRGGNHARYVPTGHLVYNAAGSLSAVGFDPGRLEVTGTPAPMPEQVAMTSVNALNAAVASNGTLVFVPVGRGGSGEFGTRRSLMWVDRQGRETPILLPSRTYTYPRISPDGVRVALDIRDEQNDIWVWEPARQTLTRQTFDPGSDFYPVWTPDSRRIIYYSGGRGGNIFWQPSDGTGMAERLTSNTSIPHYSYSVSPDGKSVAFQETLPKTGIDISLLVLDPKPRIQPLIYTPSVETNAEISPNGRWIAYQSNESGQEEIYVRPFPKVEDGRWQVSTGGGTRPVWAQNGRELFYLDENNLLTTVAVQTTSTFSWSTPVTLLKTPYFSGFGGGGQTVAGRTYDVSPDGQRFLMIRGTDREQAQVNLVVVQNWFEELKRLVPTP